MDQSSHATTIFRRTWPSWSDSVAGSTTRSSTKTPSRIFFYRECYNSGQTRIPIFSRPFSTNRGLDSQKGNKSCYHFLCGFYVMKICFYTCISPFLCIWHTISLCIATGSANMFCINLHHKGGLNPMKKLTSRWNTQINRNRQSLSKWAIYDKR